MSRASATTPGQSRTGASSARRQEILDTAAAVFAEKGIVAATVRDISERAGILSGSLYHHFTSKEAMIAEVLAPVIGAQIEEFDRIVAEHDDPAEILRLVIAAEVEQSARTPLVARILRQDEHHIGTVAGLEAVAKQRRAIRARVESVITTGIKSGHFRADCDPALAALALFDLTLSAYRHLKPLGRYRTEELASRLSTLLLHGALATPSADATPARPTPDRRPTQLAR
jgi:TetR/AcrR family transcriptional regulator, cholesterol catabolism regulator